MKISVKVTKNLLPTLAQRMPQETHEITSRSLLRVQDGCRRRSRVDTGEMRDAWAVAFTSPTEGEVFNDSDHVLPNEYGTVHMTAQPMLAPSIDEERPKYVAEVARMLNNLG